MNFHSVLLLLYDVFTFNVPVAADLFETRWLDELLSFDVMQFFWIINFYFIRL